MPKLSFLTNNMNKEFFTAILVLCVCSAFLSCNNNKQQKPVKAILTQETIDSLMRNYKPQSITYKGVVANIGAREYNFTFDSGKNVSLKLETKSPDLKMQIFEEKTNAVTKDSVTSYFKKFELIDETLEWGRVMERKTDFKIKLQLKGESAMSKNIVPFEMKVLK